MKTQHEQLNRREFLTGTGVVAGTAALGLLAACDTQDRRQTIAAREPDLGNWDDVRSAFDLDPSKLHFAAFVLASHPKPVRDAIARHRQGLDRDAFGYLGENEIELDRQARQATADYLEVPYETVSLTDSTTMGLGLLYGGIRLEPGQEIVATEHDFYSTHEALRLRAESTGASFRKIRLFRDPSTATTDEIIDSIARGVSDRTRVLAVTWVHSSTGMKLPIRLIADLLAHVNAGRQADPILLCVDSVHGFGIESDSFDDLGCDFLVSGCHKWLFGPRGTGMIAGRAEAWESVEATIPTFEIDHIVSWITGQQSPVTSPALLNTPGGFQTFENRWALKEAFDFHAAIGKDRVAERTHALAAQLKESLADIDGVTVVTPMTEELSAGLVCFEVDGRPAPEIVEALRNLRGVIASVTPYAQAYVRMGPSIVTSEEDVDEAVRVIRSLV